MSRTVVSIIIALQILACNSQSPVDPTNPDPPTDDSPTAQPPTTVTSGSYRVFDLGTLGGEESMANDISNTGVVVGWTRTATQPNAMVPFRWTGENMEPLAEWSIGEALIVGEGGEIVGRPGIVWKEGIVHRVSEDYNQYFNAYEVSRTGNVLVTGSDDYHIQHAVILITGEEINLGHLSNRQFTYPSAMNSSGTIVGYSDNQTNQGGDMGAMLGAFVWRNGAMSQLPTLGEHPCPEGDGPVARGICWFAVAEDINESGDIVGFSRSPVDRLLRPVIWRNDAIGEIGALPGRHARAELINNRGQIILRTTDPERAYLWSDGVVTDLGTLGGEWTVVEAMNENGVIVGQSANASGNAQAFVWAGGKMSPLGYGPRGGTTSGVKAINERGEIVGWTKGPQVGGQEKTRAILWRPL